MFFSSCYTFPLMAVLAAAMLPLTDARRIWHLDSPDRTIPPIPERPDYIDPAAFHDDGKNPALVRVPVFLYARVDVSVRACYAEGASNAKGDGLNPGTDTPHSINPGTNCMSPEKYSGAKLDGAPTVVYVSAQFCATEWRIDYAVYYVHDGNLSVGHRHDWEGVTVVFTKDPMAAARGDDWWLPHGVIFRTHSQKFFYDWSQINTVDGTADVRDDIFANGKNHPKVYLGLFSHASFRNKCDIGCASLTNVGEPSANIKYRSSDWYRLPAASDLRLYDTIPEAWCFDDARWNGQNPWRAGGMDTPWKTKLGICTWNVEAGPRKGTW